MAKRYTTNMVRSIKWITTLTNMQNFKRLALFAALPFIFSLLTFCKTTLVYTEGKQGTYTKDTISYLAAFPKKEAKGVLLYLAADPDTIDWMESDLFKDFSKEGYIIFKPLKRYNDDIYLVNDLDDGPTRVRDVINSTSGFVKKQGFEPEQMVIFGSGEGARIAVSTLSSLKAKDAILLNFALYGDLFELKQMAQKDSVSPEEIKALERLYIPYSRIDEILEELLTDTKGHVKYGGYLASRWRSYNKLPLPRSLANPQTNIHLYDFEGSYFPTFDNAYSGLVNLQLLDHSLSPDTLKIPEDKEETIKEWSDKIWEDLTRED